MHHLTPAEEEQLEHDGYVTRAQVFDRAELDAMIASSEELVAGLVESLEGRRFNEGSYVF